MAAAAADAAPELEVVANEVLDWDGVLAQTQRELACKDTSAATPVPAAPAAIEYRVVRDADIKKMFPAAALAASAKRVAERPPQPVKPAPAPEQTEKKARTAPAGAMLPLEYKYAFDIGSAELTDAQIESIVVGKPKSARAPKKGFSVSIGRFNENVFLYCDDCATLADAPIQKSEQFGSYSIAMGLTNTTAIKNLTKISAYLATKSCANGKMGVLLETEDDLTKQFVGLADASGHVQLSLRDLEDATKRAFTILDAEGLALDPDNIVIGNRPVRRLVFQIAFISFTAKDANITTYKPLVYLELGAQTATPAADGARTTAAAPIAWGRR